MGWITWKHNRRGCDVKPTYNLVFLPTIEPLYWRILEWDGGAWFLGQVAAWQQRLVTAYIEEHLSEQISLATLAQLARLSPYYFCRAFKRSFGMPPHRYHNVRRIEHAKMLLAQPTYSVTQIALKVGFSETSSFTAAFRKAAGSTPTAYRRSLG